MRELIRQEEDLFDSSLCREHFLIDVVLSLGDLKKHVNNNRILIREYFFYREFVFASSCLEFDKN